MQVEGAVEHRGTRGTNSYLGLATDPRIKEAARVAVARYSRARQRPPDLRHLAGPSRQLVVLIIEDLDGTPARP